MSASSRLVVILDRAEVGVATLKAVKSFTGAGLMEIRSTVAAGLPVIDEEMFTNAWFDERARQLVALLKRWQEQGVGFRLWEAPADIPAALAQLESGAGELSLAVLKNIVENDDPGECR